MTEPTLGQLIYESGMYHLQLMGDIIERDYQTLHDQCEYEHFLNRIHKVLHG